MDSYAVFVNLSAYSGFEILVFIASTMLAVLLFGCLVVWLVIDKMSLIFLIPVTSIAASRAFPVVLFLQALSKRPEKLRLLILLDLIVGMALG